MRRAKYSADLDTLYNDNAGIKSIGVLGLKPCIILKGILPVDLLTKLLYANLAVGKMQSQSPGRSPTRHLNRFPRLRFTTSV